MQQVLGEHYFIDLDAIEDYLDMEYGVVTGLSGETETKINLIKFEMVKLLLDVVLSEDVALDDKLGLKSSSNDLSIPFKLAFNSLLNKKLINFY